MLEALERKLSYDDLRFYRSIARSQLRKDMATRRKLEEERKRQQPQKQTSWSSWIWGSSDGVGAGASGGPNTEEPAAFTGEMTDEQRRALVGNLTVIQGGKEMMKKVNVRQGAKPLPPGIQ